MTRSPADFCPAEFIAFAHELADAAGAAIRPHFRKLAGIEIKGDHSPVTVADRAAERAMRDLIEARYPTHGIFGEEFGTVRGDADHVWILDPVDGTKSFIAGLPMFGTLIALAWQGNAILGIIDQPILRERWLGARGQPTTFNGAPVRSNAACTTLATATLFTTSMEMFADTAERERFQALAEKTRIRRYTGECYAYGLLASGFADVVIDSEVKPYDFAALVPVVEGAGGRITDWEGRPLSMTRNSRVLAAGTAALTTAASALLAG